ncbi:MAG: MarR family winged helix-turn-helix transcriptional regulator [Eubacterium sp.]
MINYRELAEEFVAMHANTPRLRTTKEIEEFSRGEMQAMYLISSSSGDVHPGDITKALMVSTARTAAMLKALEHRGLIVRETDPYDSRQVIVKLTDKGKDFVDRRREEVIARTVKMFEYLGEEDAKAFVRIQKKLIDSGVEWR